MNADEARVRAETAKRSVGFGEPLQPRTWETPESFAFLLDLTMDPPACFVDRSSGAVTWEFGPGVPQTLSLYREIGVSAGS